MNHASHRQEKIARVAEALEGYVRNRSTYQGDRIMTVPAGDYTDHARWQCEVDQLFMKLPLVVAMSCELPEPGMAKALEMMDVPVLVTRDEDGVARAFLNVCAHRGAPVMENGHRRDCRQLVCPYHGWSYRLNGDLKAVSDGRLFGDVDKAARGLRALPCAEQAGFIFAILTPGMPIDPDGFYGEMLDDFEAAGFADYTFLGAREIEGANWKIALDGYVEGYHFNNLHPETIAPRTFSNLTHYEAFGPHLRIGFAQRDMLEKLENVPREAWGAQENNGFDFVRILFPNVSVFMAPEIVQVAQLFPGPTPDRNRTILNFARKEPPKDEEDAATCEGMVNFLRDVVRDEDYAIGEGIQKGLASGAHDSMILGKNERGNQYIHEWIDWYVAGDEGAEKPVL